MAAVTGVISTTSTANASSYASGSFTPALGDLLVVFVQASATVAAGTLTSSRTGFTFSKVTSALNATDTIYCFVANQLVTEAVSQTVTFDCTGDAATGAIIQIAAVSGISKFGNPAASVRQSAVSDNQASGGTPAATFGSSCLTGNPTLGVVGNDSNPAGLTAPTSWTERDDTGYGTPTSGAEYVSRDSGFTGTTITWGSTSATAFGVVIIEIDASTVSPPPQALLQPMVAAYADRGY